MKVIDNQAPRTPRPTLGSLQVGTVCLYMNMPAIVTDELEGDAVKIVSLASGNILYPAADYIPDEVYPNATVLLHGEKKDV